MRQIIFAIAVISALASQLFADDFRDVAAQNWHQWRGPTADGVSDSANPPVQWSETKNIKWKVSIKGKGNASPIVFGKRVFLAHPHDPKGHQRGTSLPRSIAPTSTCA